MEGERLSTFQFISKCPKGGQSEGKNTDKAGVHHSQV